MNRSPRIPPPPSCVSASSIAGVSASFVAAVSGSTFAGACRSSFAGLCSSSFAGLRRSLRVGVSPSAIVRVLVPLALCLCTALASAAPRAASPSLTAYATLTSDYRKRGLSHSDGDGAIQAGLDYQHRSGWFTGLWASTVGYEIDEPWTERRDGEVEVYTGYNWRNPKWSAMTAVARYAYLDTSVDYDYDELSAGFGYRQRVFVTLSYTDALLSVGPSLLDAEVTFAVPLPHGIELGGTVGRVNSDAYYGGGYTHWNAGLSRPFGPMGLDLRFYDNDAEGYRLYGDPLPDRWVLSVSYGFSRR